MGGRGHLVVSRAWAVVERDQGLRSFFDKLITTNAAFCITPFCVPVPCMDSPAMSPLTLLVSCSHLPPTGFGSVHHWAWLPPGFWFHLHHFHVGLTLFSFAVCLFVGLKYCLVPKIDVFLLIFFFVFWWDIFFVLLRVVNGWLGGFGWGMFDSLGFFNFQPFDYYLSIVHDKFEDCW